jgi:hypothetical protein
MARATRAVTTSRSSVDEGSVAVDEFAGVARKV